MKLILTLIFAILITGTAISQNKRSQTTSDWTTVTQKIQIETDTIKNFTFKGYIKAETVTDKDTVGGGSLISITHTEDDPYAGYKLSLIHI